MKKEIFDELGRSKGFYSSKNRVNNLTGKEWVFWTRSVINKQYPVNLQHKLRSLHGGQKPPHLCRDLIQIFTKKGQRVFDPFMGVGGILLGAALCKRQALGIELNKQWIDIYKEVCKKENIEEMLCITGDSLKIIPKLENEKFDLIFTDVPYWNMDRVPRSKGKYKKYGRKAEDPLKSKLSKFNDQNYKTKTEWLLKMREIFQGASALLKEKAYILVFIGDMYFSNEYHCLSYELAAEIKQIKNIVWKANIIWYDVSKKLHLYGYQYSYIPSMIHQNILVFRKEP